MLLLPASFTRETPRMSISLLESRHRSQRSLGYTLFSIGLHAILITLAVYATANAGELLETKPTIYVDVFYPPHSSDLQRAHEEVHPSKQSTHGLPRRQTFEHIAISDPKLPTLNVAADQPPAESLFATGNTGTSSHDADAPAGSDSGEPMFASQVDKPAVEREGNPIPKYPSLLESSRVEGIVLVRFVVDTLGNADMSTLTVLEASNELFVRAFAAMLPKWRFYPAEANGRKVKQIVELPLKFIAPDR
jgi:outer membrane biosynthesis protein TonB